MKEYELKKILNNLIETAYPDDPLKKRYLGFYVTFEESKTCTSVHAYYYEEDHSIHIFNMYRSAAALTLTVIHELSHHIDFIRNGDTGHQKEFYKAYAELLYAAFDLGLLTPEDITIDGAHSDSRDYSKVLKIAEAYIPKNKEKKPENIVLLVSPGFERKDLVKERGYRYNSASRHWEKEFSPEEVEEERNWLRANELPYEERSASVVDIRTGIYIYAINRGEVNWTYRYREKLKEFGFRYLKDRRCWRKEMQSGRELKNYKELMPEIAFKTVPIRTERR